MQGEEPSVLLADTTILSRLRSISADCRVDSQERAEIECVTAKTAAGTTVRRINLWMRRLGLSHRDVLLMARGKNPRRKPRDILGGGKRSAGNLRVV